MWFVSRAGKRYVQALSVNRRQALVRHELPRGGEAVQIAEFRHRAIAVTTHDRKFRFIDEAQSRPDLIGQPNYVSLHRSSRIRSIAVVDHL